LVLAACVDCGTYQQFLISLEDLLIFDDNMLG